MRRGTGLSFEHTVLGAGFISDAQTGKRER